MSGDRVCGPAVAALVAFCALLPSRVLAAGFGLIPEVSVVEIYNDNIFLAPEDGPDPTVEDPQDPAVREGKEEDFITRIRPAVSVVYEGKRFSLFAGYGIAADIYAEHSDLSSAGAQHSASAGGTAAISQRLSGSIVAGYSESSTGSNLNSLSAGGDVLANAGIAAPAALGSQSAQVPTDSGLLASRRRATRVYASPSLAYRLTRRTSLTAGYQFNRTEQRGAATSTANSTRFGVNHALTEVDVVGLSYGFRNYSFDDEPADDVGATRENGEDRSSHSVMAHWSRQLTEFLRAGIEGGARFSDGDVAPEAGAVLAYTLRDWGFGLSYRRTQTTSVGEGDVLDSDLGHVDVRYQPTPQFLTSVDASYTRAERSGEESDTEAFRAGVHASYVALTWLSFGAGYNFLQQDGDIGLAGASVESGSSEIVRRNVVAAFLRVVFPVGDPQVPGGSILGDMLAL